MKVTELAKSLNTTPGTVRFYTRIGVISPDTNPNNGYKIYGKSAQHRLKFVLNARQLEFSVDEIKSILSEADKGHSACPLVRGIIEKHLTETEKKFKDALLLREKLRNAIDDWGTKPKKEPTSHMICHLIEGDEYEGDCHE